MLFESRAKSQVQESLAILHGDPFSKQFSGLTVPMLQKYIECVIHVLICQLCKQRNLSIHVQSLRTVFVVTFVLDYLMIYELVYLYGLLCKASLSMFCAIWTFLSAFEFLHAGLPHLHTHLSTITLHVLLYSYYISSMFIDQASYVLYFEYMVSSNILICFSCNACPL